MPKPLVHPGATIRRSLDQTPEVFQGAVLAAANGELRWPLVLIGSQGTGKSCAALTLCDWVHRSLFWRLATLLRELHKASRAEGPCVEVAYWQGFPGPDGDYDNLKYRLDKRTFAEWELWERFKTAPLIVIDDIGVRGDYTGWQVTQFQEFLDTREGLPTVLTSNLPLDKLEAVFDSRILSRLAAGTILRFGGTDRRTQSNKKPQSS